jgi:hypothetical protein
MPVMAMMVTVVVVTVVLRMCRGTGCSQPTKHKQRDQPTSNFA